MARQDQGPHQAPTPLRERAHSGDFSARLDQQLAAAQAEIERLRVEKEAAQQLADARARWLAHVSHELRTPMNGIIGMTELTLESDLTEAQREQLALVRRSADSLLTLVNDILDHTKITAKRLDIEAIPFNIRDAVADVMATMAAAHRSHDRVKLETNVTADVPYRVVGDPGRLRQVIVNLVGNALKFTEHGAVTLDVTSTGAAEQVLVQFAVRDTGIGIPADKIDTVFEPFRQAETTITREYGGTGLGLAISRQLVELMGGEIAVESRMGVGTEFRFTVAVAPAPAPDTDFEVAHLDMADVRVLVVSDSKVNEQALLDVLEAERIGAMVVETLDEALRYIGKAAEAGRPIDQLVLDLQVAGLEIAAAVAERGIGATRLLLITPSGQRGDAARCRLLGVSAYITGTPDAVDLAAAFRSVAAGTPELITRHWLRERRRPLRVLLADDSSTNRALTTRILERRGHSVRCVANGAAALAAHAEEPFDVILLDVEMPVMDGPAAAEAIRSDPGRGRTVPIVALTGHVAAADKRRFAQAGIDEVLHKPVQADALGSLLHRLADPAPVVPRRSASN